MGVELRGGGDALVRVSGRRGMRLRLFRVPDDHLQELAELMRAAYEPAALPPLAAEQASDDEPLPSEPASGVVEAVPPVESAVMEPIMDWPEPDVVVMDALPAVAEDIETADSGPNEDADPFQVGFFEFQTGIAKRHVRRSNC